MEKIDLIAIALSDKSETGDEKRREIRKDSLLGKPITQLVLTRAFLKLKASSGNLGEKYTNDEICQNLNRIDWDPNNSILWEKVLMNGSRIATGKPAISLATDYISYMAGEHLEEQEIVALEDKYKKEFPLDEQQYKNLPDRVV